MNRLLALLLPLVFTAPLALPAEVAASAVDSENVLQVLIVSVAPGKIDRYVDRVAKLQAIQERLGTIGRMRMWRATLGGSTSGNVIVSIEYDDLNSFAENFARLEADPEWQQIMDELPAIRDLLSSGLYTEISPP
jgi:hypothetical protein